MSVKKKRNLLLAVSAGFVGLMVLISIGLYLAGGDNAPRVESQSVPEGPTYDLSEYGDLSIADPEGVDLRELDPEFTNNFNVGEFDANQQVPEPASISLLAAGGLGILARRRRKTA
ncbi:MAG: PEP-CTERM sorting domain-containing protein [Planctomycetes bacterium]|jgi:hypothetical protein|nr:PEP-CTERM sorting domain-containing protein [Planctomycetota bacterium]